MKRHVVTLLTLILFVSCEKKGPTEYGPSVGSVQFKVGGYFQYEWYYEMVDSVGTIVGSLGDTIAVSVEGVNESVGSYSNLVKLKLFSIQDFQGSSYVWYSHSDSQFTEIGYQDAGRTPVVAPKIQGQGSNNRVLRRSIFLSTPLTLQKFLADQQVGQGDSIIIRQDPRVVYRYPFVIGQSWTSFTSPFLQIREVIGDTTIMIQGVSQYVLKIKTTLPAIDPDIEWYDYVNPSGLMRRTLTFKNPGATAPDDPTPIGTFTVHERLEPLIIDP